jgi:tRNA/tmRNA/rRNA uracil-C5-methylase (TrmA/RlmC/RlmD family)
VSESNPTVLVEKPAAGGRMIGRAGGEVLLIRGAIPGERVRCRIEGRRRGVAYATVTDVLEADPDRRGTGTAPACGGNVYAYIALPRQRLLKAQVIADAFARVAHMPLAAPVTVAASPAEGYRLRARLHVQSGAVGFFRDGTHELCEAGSTGQLLPSTVDVLAQVSRVLRSTGSDAVSEIELSENLTADQRALHFRVAPGGLDSSIAARLAGIPGLTGLGTATAGGSQVEMIAGDSYVADPIGSLATGEDRSIPGSNGTVPPTLRRQARAFFQGNRFLLPQLVSNVIDRIAAGPVVDLYSGVGLFACALAARGHGAITAVEGDRISGDDLVLNAGQFGGAIRVARMAVESFLERADSVRAHTVIVDPPRTGLSREAMAGLIGVRAPVVTYVSCDPPTLARDARRLVDAGYRLTAIEAFDLFPNTAHIETVAEFSQG